MIGNKKWTLIASSSSLDVTTKIINSYFMVPFDQIDKCGYKLNHVCQNMWHICKQNESIVLEKFRVVKQKKRYRFEQFI